MNKRFISISIAVVTLIIIFEAALLLHRCSSDKQPGSASSANAVTHSDTVVTINDVQLPSYSYRSVVCIAAEDLHNFGFEAITTGSSFSLSYNPYNQTTPPDGILHEYSDIPDDSVAEVYKDGILLNGKSLQCYITYGYHLIPAYSLKSLFSITEENGSIHFSTADTTTLNNVRTVSKGSNTLTDSESDPEFSERKIEGSSNAKNYRSPSNNTSRIIVLDPGHGKSSSRMSDEEKTTSGFVYNASKKQWGEWRHWKSGNSSTSCEGTGCTQTHTPGGSCWYAMGNGDRNTEPEINLNNALAAKKYLEEMGYTVRMTRTSKEENPSFSRRLSYCYPNNDNTQQADALLYMCIHSNAGGGRGSAYIAAEGQYDQKGIRASYINDCNTLGAITNEKITKSTSLKKSGSGVINNLGALIAFCKSPVTCGYLEIGFYDNSEDLKILQNESDAIGKAIAEGIDEFVNGSY